MLGNLVARSSEIGILKAVGWTEKDVQKQLMGEALIQSFLGGLVGLIVGYGISYALGFFSIPVSTPWEINLMPAFARDTETAAAVAVRLPVDPIGGTHGSRPRSFPFCGRPCKLLHGEAHQPDETGRYPQKAMIGRPSREEETSHSAFLESDMPSLGSLFFRILKLGATAYGGPAMISQIKETTVNRYGWVKEGEFMRGVALCQLIPGATMVQIVTYVGYRVRGVLGARTAAVAFVLPAFIALLVLSAIYFKFQTLWFIQALFKGLGAIVVAIIFNACITFGRSVLKDRKVMLIAALSFFAFYFQWNFVFIFFLAAVAGLLLHPKTLQTKAMPSGPEFSGAQKKEYLIVALAGSRYLLGVYIFLFRGSKNYGSLPQSVQDRSSRLRRWVYRHSPYPV